MTRLSENPTVDDVDFDNEEGYVAPNREDLFAKEQLKRFIFADIETNIVFECPIGEGDKIIQRMRVRLSKLRKLALKKNRVIQEFKMLRISVVHNTEKSLEIVTVRKSKNKLTDVSRELARITEEFPIVEGKKLGDVVEEIKPIPVITNIEVKEFKS